MDDDNLYTVAVYVRPNPGGSYEPPNLIVDFIFMVSQKIHIILSHIMWIVCDTNCK